MSMTYQEWEEFFRDERALALGIEPDELDWYPTREDIEAGLVRLHAQITAAFAAEHVVELSDQVDAMHYQLDRVAEMVAQLGHQPRRRGRC